MSGDCITELRREIQKNSDCKEGHFRYQGSGIKIRSLYPVSARFELIPDMNPRPDREGKFGFRNKEKGLRTVVADKMPHLY